MYPVCWGWEDTSVMALFKKKVYLFLITHRRSLVAGSRGFSLQRLLLLRAQALGLTGSVVAVLGLSYPEACGIFLDQGWNSTSLHRQVDS